MCSAHSYFAHESSKNCSYRVGCLSPCQNERVRCSDSVGSLGMSVSGDCFHLSAAAATEKGDAMRVGEASEGIAWSS